MKLLLLFLFSCSMLFIPENINAQSSNQTITVKPVYPENQDPESKNHFNLSVNPKDQQTVEVRVSNHANEEITVGIKVANAYSNPNGGILYEPEMDSENTELLEDAVKMANYLNVQETVTIPPTSFVDVPVDVKVPDVNGQVLLGAVLFSSLGEDTDQQELKEGTANFIINTEMVYAIPVRLNLPNKSPFKFSLGDVGFISEDAQLYTEMINDTHNIQREIVGTYVVSDDQGKELFNGEFGNFMMAPKSKIRYPISWGYESLEDGKYTLSIEGTAGEEEFSSSKSFTIENQDVEEYIENTQPNQPQAQIDNGIPTIVWIIGGIVLAILMYFLGRRKSK
ncbi:WxL protein peptidoglycan domain-containing protein [Salinibacillus xinjiangensis]|uniref:WxL protein peptidoglycan domain-containing protein n=1 Tax=Salinibacillus xinjiangensis TaxID=1229268 RepID=UPI0018913D54|nr:DUF916 domain-containing protein [Salinibacillus xinjiangensis]